MRRCGGVFIWSSGEVFYKTNFKAAVQKSADEIIISKNQRKNGLSNRTRLNDKLFKAFNKNRNNGIDWYEPADAIRAELGKGPISQKAYKRLVTRWGLYFDTGYITSAENWGKKIVAKMYEDLKESRKEAAAIRGRFDATPPPPDMASLKELNYVPPVTYTEYLWLMNTRNK